MVNINATNVVVYTYQSFFRLLTCLIMLSYCFIKTWFYITMSAIYNMSSFAKFEKVNVMITRARKNHQE